MFAQADLSLRQAHMQFCRKCTGLNVKAISGPIATVKIKNIIPKTRLYNFDPLKPNFYKVKLGFTVGIDFFFLFC